MSPQAVKALCESFPSACFEFKIEWETEVAFVADKLFALHGFDKENYRILTLKAKPEDGEYLRQNYESIITAGYHMNKRHWISIRLDEIHDDGLVQQLALNSYNLIVDKLPRRIRETL
ncbi:MmcQ/YjbR family DNA-binding protein [Erysipelothrix anatis]|uniref:MmcQ/YjbR family DNA-binding protein n=1 Tax=Erysipelothrix anatis TaxID=2683713 RepID=UPI001356C0B6|nr:MmcQ/YjbR family DNA-binding protein [Erysipelothrix anatis]